MKLTVLTAALLLAGCTPPPESWPIPTQRFPSGASDGTVLDSFITMSDPRVFNYLVGDVREALEGSWRWTGQKPELRFRVEDPAGMRLRVSYAIPEQIYKPLFPVTLCFFVNGQKIDEVVHRTGGRFEYAKALPPGALHANAENRLRIEMDRVFVAPSDGARLGMILESAGFSK